MCLRVEAGWLECEGGYLKHKDQANGRQMVCIWASEFLVTWVLCLSGRCRSSTLHWCGRLAGKDAPFEKAGLRGCATRDPRDLVA